MTSSNPENNEPEGPVHGDAVRVTLRAQEGTFLGRGPDSIGIRTPDGQLKKYRHAEVARIEVVSDAPTTTNPVGPALTRTISNPEDYEPDGTDLDRMTRAQLAELPGPEHTVADVLDEWNHREHGVISSSHGVGLFLDLLAAQGYRVTPIEETDLSGLLPPATD